VLGNDPTWMRQLYAGPGHCDYATLQWVG
jgi:hypothetical protein